MDREDKPSELAEAALAHGGQIGLRHHRNAPAVGGDLQQGGEIRIPAPYPQDALPAAAVERLHHSIAPLRVDEGAQLGNGGGHQGRRHQVGKAQREQLLVRRPQPPRMVDQQWPGSQLDELRCAKEFDVHGRILAQEQHVQLGERRVELAHDPEVGAGLSLDLDGAHARARLAVREVQPLLS